MAKKPSKDYDVGYGKPPRANRFKPGQSGNLRGRPRKVKSFRSSLEDLLSRQVAYKEAGQTKKAPVWDVIIRQMSLRALNGDAKATAMLLKLMDGHRMWVGGVQEQSPDYTLEVYQKIEEMASRLSAE